MNASRAVAVSRATPGMVRSWATTGSCFADGGELVLHLKDASLEIADLLAQLGQERPQSIRHVSLSVLDQRPDGWYHLAGAAAGMKTPNSHSSPRSVLMRAVRSQHPTRAQPMQ